MSQQVRVPDVELTAQYRAVWASGDYRAAQSRRSSGSAVGVGRPTTDYPGE